MKTTNIFFLTFLISILLTACSDDTPEHLKGLTKASMPELELPDGFDMLAIPTYSMEGELIDKDSIVDILLDGDFTTEPYVDENQQIKAFVFRETTPAEKKQMQEFAKMMNGNSETIGTTAGAFSVTDLEGNQWSLEDLRGEIVVINFWFIACKPCVQEIPELNELVEKYEERVKFLAFAADKKDALEVFLTKTPFEYHIIPESRQVAETYQVMGYPTHIVVDKNSTITYATTGLGSNTISELIAEIENLFGD